MSKYKYHFIALGVAVLVGIGVTLNILFAPHIDVQATESFEKTTVGSFVDQAIKDINTFNDKYLAADGESKVIEIEGIVYEVSQNMNNETVILLKDNSFKDAGVLCTMLDTLQAVNPAINSKVAIKGIVRSGAEFDEDLELYIDAVLEKGKIIN